MRGGDKGLVGSQRPGKTARPRAGYHPPQLHPPWGHLLLRKRLSPAFLKKGASLLPGFPLRPLAGAPGVAAPRPAAAPALAAAGMKAGGSSPCLSPPVGSEPRALWLLHNFHEHEKKKKSCFPG